MNAQANDSPVGPAEDETDDFVSSLLPYLGVTVAVATIVVTTLIAVMVHVLHI
jgi:hypothetical protein